MEKTRNIYICVSQTGTILSRICKAITKDSYNHVSISLDSKLENMYSFGRLNPYNPVMGGFVMESPKYGTFKRFYKTDAVIIGIPVEAETYTQIERQLKRMYQNKRDYHYNYIGLVVAIWGKLWKKDKTFYCSEFVADVLQKNGIIPYERKLYRPNEFLEMGGSVVYNGKLRAYPEEAAKSA